jgi:hypothetical protein
MVTRELVQAELERLSVAEPSKVYRYIKQVAHEKPKNSKKQSLMASLSAIEIEARRIFPPTTICMPAERKVRDKMFFNQHFAQAGFEMMAE